MRVDTKAELAEFLRKYPLQLRAARATRSPRPGHPDFIGPRLHDSSNCGGGINFDSEGAASFTIRKEAWARAQDEKILNRFGDL